MEGWAWRGRLGCASASHLLPCAHPDPCPPSAAPPAPPAHPPHCLMQALHHQGRAVVALPAGGRLRGAQPPLHLRVRAPAHCSRGGSGDGGGRGGGGGGAAGCGACRTGSAGSVVPWVCIAHFIAIIWEIFYCICVNCRKHKLCATARGRRRRCRRRCCLSGGNGLGSCAGGYCICKIHRRYHLHDPYT